MSDRQRFLARLREAGPCGLHSHTVRREGISGHPSERAAELTRQGYTIERRREYVNGRNGTRFYLLSEPPRADAGVDVGQRGDAARGDVERTRSSSTGIHSGESPQPSQEAPGEPPALFELPAPEPLSAIRHPEAA